MTDEELLEQCKTGLGIKSENMSQDEVLAQKLLAVKSFMRRAGVSEETMNDDLAIGVIVMGVTDLWSTDGGGIKFSPAFYTLVGQLAMG